MFHREIAVKGNTYRCNIFYSYIFLHKEFQIVVWHKKLLHIFYGRDVYIRINEYRAEYKGAKQYYRNTGTQYFAFSYHADKNKTKDGN